MDDAHGCASEQKLNRLSGFRIGIAWAGVVGAIISAFHQALDCLLDQCVACGMLRLRYAHHVHKSWR